ncbi:ABC transporter ATP-binding protein [Bartonella sp. LJL80]
MAQLTIKNVTLSYGTNPPILKDISIGPLAGGQMIALLGSNAAGKSTLLKRMAGLLQSDGSVEINGNAVETLPSWHSDYPAYVPQDITMVSSMSIFEAVLLAGKQGSGWAVNHNDLDRVIDVLDMVGIAHIGHLALASLSGGQRQLVSIAQALVRAPQILLLDEPTSALDLANQLDMLELLKRLSYERGLCIVMAIHDINHALRFCDQAIVLHQGSILAVGDSKEVLTASLMETVYEVEALNETSSHGLDYIIVERSLRKIRQAV